MRPISADPVVWVTAETMISDLGAIAAIDRYIAGFEVEPSLEGRGSNA